jgi:peroxiredoxin
MKTRFRIVVLACCCTFVATVLAQPKDAKKAAPPKAPADIAADDFYKVRNQQGAKLDQAHFSKVIGAGLEYLTKYPTHGRANEVIRDFGNYPGVFREKNQAAQRTAVISQIRYELLNARYKEGLSDDAKAALAALDASTADYEVRDALSGGTANKAMIDTLREKIDALAELPGSGRYLPDRERSAFAIVAFTTPQKIEEHLQKLANHKDKGVVALAREELTIVQAKKEPLALQFTAVDGKSVDTAQLRGKVIALYFWSTTNRDAAKNIQALQQIYSDYRKKGLEVVSVSYDKPEDKEKLDKFIKENGIKWPVYFDGKMAKNDFAPKLNATSSPRLMIFDQGGILQSQVKPTGLTHTFAMNEVEGKVKQLLEPPKKK